MQSFFVSHDPALVGLSYAISVIGALISLYLADFIVERDGSINPGWLTLAAVIFGGCAIWAMHFTGMLAFRMEGPVSYDVGTTLLSLGLPILLSGLGLFAAHRWRDSVLAWLGSGVVFGLGVAAMHYVGMSAMRMPMAMTHDTAITALSIVIAIVAATAALRIIVHWRGVKRLVSPLLMGLAVCGMHYTAMYGMSFSPSEEARLGVDYFQGAWTEGTVGFLSGLWVSMALFVGAALAVFRKLSEVEEHDVFAGT